MHRVTMETTDTEHVADEIRLRLIRFNEQRAGPMHDVRVVLSVRDERGELVGGLVALGFWNGLFIELLWVQQGERGRGIGTSLMRAAEAEARKNGWKVCFLSSFTFQAPEFYRKLGYEPFGELEGMPPEHSRTWFAKWLA
jgi:predicted N-acetyltransferase YhbS